ncbi:undecaprenyl-diphosphatase UppP [Xenococcus sp. PCC 7305]|uniref:undecaprenyl-diphosphate phosphatase n=1 Tax=Xenococcus sp. PCC 7305 TaxID=102125 RepID=UPI0002ACE4C3|nr:undecaprenyl-diphosphate phosphatase [Xenococcus sp. PCC 7305]ELS02249.1 undecaprenyl-diphosphatase UppP [Xenococcus sp. PCC 7305]
MADFAKKYLEYVFLIILGFILSLFVAQANVVYAKAADYPEVIAQLTTTPDATSTVSQVNLFQAIVLGFVQGATEFIPISSTAHLKAVPVFLGWGDPGVAFSAIIQLGSIAAVLSYFWDDLAEITQGMVKAVAQSDYDSQNFWLALGIGVGTIPIVICGLGIKLFVPDFDNSPLRSMTSIAIASIVMALLLGLSEYIGNHKRNFEDLTTKDGIIIGFAQALAIIPGVSRSGSTITAGLFNNIDRATAARFSFLLGIPAITLAGLVEFRSLWETGIMRSELLPLIAGLISSAIFSYLAIAWLLKFLQKRSTWVFVWYRLGFGITILISLAKGWL